MSITKTLNNYLKSNKNEKARSIHDALDSAQKHNEKYNAFVKIFDQQNIQIDENTLLQGAPIAIKDSICYKETTACSNILKNFKPEYNATVAQKLIDNGANIIGKLNCDEFCMGSDGSTSNAGKCISIFKNDNNDEMLPGGSSSGSAVAINMESCLASLGSDTGGSVRLPAVLNGLVGYRPSYGYISRHGVVAYASSYDQVGVLSKTIEDCKIVSNILVGHDEKDFTTEIKAHVSSKINPVKNRINKSNNKLKIAIMSCGCDDAYLENINNIRKLISKDCDISDIKAPMLSYIAPMYQILTFSEACSNLARYDHVRFKNDYEVDNTKSYKENATIYRSQAFGDVVKSRIIAGAYFMSEHGRDTYVKANAMRAELIDIFNKIFNEYDFIIHPTLLSSHGIKKSNCKFEIYSDIDTYLTFAPHIKTPGVTIPSGINNGIPMGLHIMGKRHDDCRMLDFGHMLEVEIEREFKVKKQIHDLISKNLG